MNDRDMIIELFTVTEIKENGEVVFCDRSIEIIKELGEKYAQTPLFKQERAKRPDWEGDTNAGLLFIYMCERITDAPTTIHATMVPKLLLPILWGKLQEEMKEVEQAAVQEEDTDTAAGGLEYAT